MNTATPLPRTWPLMLLGVLITLLLTLQYTHDTFAQVDTARFTGFQQDSEALVLAGILAARSGASLPTGLGFALDPSLPTRGGLQRWSYDDIANSYRLMTRQESVPGLQVSPYLKQYGLHARLYAGLNTLSLDALHLLTAGLFALAVVLSAALLARPLGWSYSLAWVLAMFTSPVVSLFARNLYWAPFTWLLPLIAALLLARAQDSGKRAWQIVAAAGVFAAVLIRCLCGYEYLPTLLILAAAPGLMQPFRPGAASGALRLALKRTVLLAALSVLAFSAALLMHASVRGPQGILTGLKTVLLEDALRRTYGNPKQYESALSVSLSRPLTAVVRASVQDWSLPVLSVTPRLSFPLLLTLTGLILALGAAQKRADLRFRLALSVLSFAAPLSWTLLAKGHAAAHTDLNLVLWSYPLLPTMLYLAFTAFPGKRREHSVSPASRPGQTHTPKETP